MKKSLSLLLAMFVMCSAVSKENYKKIFVKTGKLKLEFHEAFQNHYAGTTEISNGEYTEFLNSLKSSGNVELYKKYYPDTARWNTSFSSSYMQPYANYYFSHPAYQNYPVVNITLEDATAYCNWLTEIYKSQNKSQDVVKFYVPNRQQWVVACKVFPGNVLPWYGAYAYDPKENLRANVSLKYPLGGDCATDLCAPVISYPPNDIGLFNMIGNVAEMTDENGIAVGGSWFNTINESGADTTTTYDTADPRVGFRVFAQSESADVKTASK